MSVMSSIGVTDLNFYVMRAFRVSGESQVAISFTESFPRDIQFCLRLLHSEPSKHTVIRGVRYLIISPRDRDGRVPTSPTLDRIKYLSSFFVNDVLVFC